MLQELLLFVQENRDTVHSLFRHYQSRGKNLILGSELWDEFNTFCQETGESAFARSPLANALKKTQEAAVADPWLYLRIRPWGRTVALCALSF